MTEITNKFLVLYDDLCVLCTWSVWFIIKHDPEKRFYFASLNDPQLPENLRSQIHSISPKTESVILYNGNTFTRESTAALTIVRYFPLPWKLLNVFWVVPGPLRDFVYRIIAKYRYRIFGKRNACRVPSEEEKPRFNFEYFLKQEVNR